MSACRKDTAGSPGEQRTAPATTGLFPLEQLLDELIFQEEELWTSYEMMAQSLRKGSAHAPAQAEDTAPSVDGSDSTVSLKNFVSSGVAGAPHSKLDLIKYGSLTSVVHKHFRKLEKRHACLYLTARKAKHETLRHVECNIATNAPDGPPEVYTAISALESESGRRVVLLRDEELLVYRCALMCAQFPQLSAPDPPDGHSPTPLIPSLPRSFANLAPPPPSSASPGSHDLLQQQHQKEEEERLLSKTAPTGFIVPSAAASMLPVVGTEGSPSSVVAARDGHGGKPVPSPSSFPAVPPGQPGEEAKRKPTAMAAAGAGRHSEASKPQPSDPIPIKGGKAKTKSSSMKARGGAGGGGGGGGESTVKLPAMDSDEEEELVELTSGKPLASSSSYSSGGGCGREHPFSPTVNREMLCRVVRCAFRQTEEQQQQAEQALRQEYGRRSKGEILAKELAGQLQVLENNAHPFYKPKLFVTRNGYDIWLQAEKQRVRNLIDKFWHFSLPRAQPWRHYNPTDYHKAYSILLQKIVGFESRTERKEPVHAGRTPSSPLSPTAQRLLSEFGLRYGVGKLFRRIVYLDYLAKHFDYEIWYIKHCTEELRGIRTLLPRNRNKITAVRREMEMLRSTVHLLHGQTDNSLTRIDRLFLDSDPREGVAALIELLAEVLDAEQSLFGKRVGPVDYWLKRYLKSGFVLRYERRKEIAADETVESRTAQPFVLTATLVNSLLLATRDEVFEYRDKYQNVFRPYFDIVPFAKLEFYRLLRADACSLCARMIHKPETRQLLSLDMLGLMYRLNERDLEWEKVVPPEDQLWRREFVDLSIVWLDVLAKQLQKWVLISLSEDEWKWTTLTFALSPGQDAAFPKRHGGPTLTSSKQPSPPFPSPAPSSPSAFTPSSLRASGGAFMPYRRPLLKRNSIPRSLASSEGSGAVTELSSQPASSATSFDGSVPIAGGIPSLLNGAKLNDKAVGSSPSSLLTFGIKKSTARAAARTAQQRRDRDIDDAGFSSAPEQPAAEEIEVSVSVYSGYEPTDGEWPPQRRLSKIGSETPPLKELDAQPDSPPTDKESASPKTTMSKKRPLQQPVTDDEEFHPSMSIDVTDPKSTVTKFGNMLDLCSGEGSDVVRPKPRAAILPPSWNNKGTFNQSTNTDEFHIPPASVATVPELADWHKDHAPSDLHDDPLNASEGDESGSTDSPESSYLESKGTMKSRQVHTPDLQSDDEAERDGAGGGGGGGGEGDEGDGSSLIEEAASPEELEEQQLEHLLFPVSSSPVDMVTMLVRLAAFTGTLLDVLTPKLKRNADHIGGGGGRGGGGGGGGEGARVTEGFAPEVLSARQQATQQWRQVESMKTEFLKKLHRTKISCLKLYADNVLCMDLCGWPGSEASRLLGDEMVHHLHRRKEAHEIWGCRHMVEERLGLHPGGIPCQQKKNNKSFESITRDMCIRINNIQTLLTLFPSLELHLHSAVKTHAQRPITALGYISSDVSDMPGGGRLKDSTFKPNPHRLRPKPDLYTDAGKATGTASWPSSISPGLGPMEIDAARSKRKRGGGGGGGAGGGREGGESGVGPEGELQSRESQGLVSYLKKVQNAQLQMLCYRMNKFFKPALSLLLDLKLGECSIEKRLCPLVMFLSRHRHALHKYIYPECFNKIMQFLWDYILQDLEEASLKLRSHKKPITDKAQMLLQALSHLIMFTHNKGDGLSIDILTSSSEFLLGLLDIMTRSTDQLLTMFNLLSAPQFARNNLDLSRAPIAMDSRVLHTLRSQLHMFKKCFSGKEFVDSLLQIGRQLETRSATPNGGLDTPTPPPPRSRRSSHGSSSRGLASAASNVLRTPDSMIEYTVRYATEMGQYLLNERILIPVANLSPSSSEVVTPVHSSDEDTSASHTQPFHSGGGGRERVQRQQPRTTPQSLESSGLSFATPASTLSTQSRAEAVLEGDVPPEFSYSAQALYKFVDSEDADISALYQSQILMASLHKTSSDTGSQQQQQQQQPEATEFATARRNTLFLVYDLLLQRGRRDRRVSQVLQGPRALTLAAQRRAGSEPTTCHFILKM